MGEASWRSGYMPLSGAASGRPLMISLVSGRGHRQILLATFSRPKAAFLQLMSPFQATCRRSLRLGHRGGQPDAAPGAAFRHRLERGPAAVRRGDGRDDGQAEAAAAAPVRRPVADPAGAARAI